jgi:hypothetical protein
MYKYNSIKEAISSLPTGENGNCFERTNAAQTAVLRENMISVFVRCSGYRSQGFTVEFKKPNASTAARASRYVLLSRSGVPVLEVRVSNHRPGNNPPVSGAPAFQMISKGQLSNSQMESLDARVKAL